MVGQPTKILSARWLAWVWMPVLAIAALHYLTPPHTHWVHDLARRLFYAPILLAGIFGGARGGLVVALVTPSPA